MSHLDIYRHKEAYAEFLANWDDGFYGKYTVSFRGGCRGRGGGLPGGPLGRGGERQGAPARVVALGRPGPAGLRRRGGVAA